MHEQLNNPLHSRGSGILLHPVSLPGKWGIGTFGPEAYRFVDMLSDAGLKYWQVLPLTPLGPGNSPYQSWSAFAGNQVMISPHILQQEGFLQQELPLPEMVPVIDTPDVDYEYAHKSIDIFLSYAFLNFEKSNILRQEFSEFCIQEKLWLDDVAIFAVIRKLHNDVSVQNWPIALRKRKNSAIADIEKKFVQQIDFQKFIQFIFFRQWFQLKEYANAKGVLFIGDLPIYVSSDSVEVWTEPRLFQLDKELNPEFVAGVPPDYFSDTGQLWGNPVYHWKYHEKTDFEWWNKRLNFSFRMFDVVRIDHFRGFSEFWAVPQGQTTAETGTWFSAPGKKLFEQFCTTFGNKPIIAEDLGIISEEAKVLRKSFGFPGMKILQFAFANPSENEFLPHFHENNSVVYTGTHDNNTTRGWFDEDVSEEEKMVATEYMQCEENNVVRQLIRLGWSSVANTVIVPLQDILDVDASGRMNTPGTVTGNWLWKITEDQFDAFPLDDIRSLNRIFGRKQ